jgi:hypothetical protein
MGAPADIPMDVPDADAAEQARDLRPEEPEVAPSSSPEVNEFDAVEQSLIIEEDEDDYR